jgi:hypothetical protein
MEDLREQEEGLRGVNEELMRGREEAEGAEAEAQAELKVSQTMCQASQEAVRRRENPEPRNETLTPKP